MRQDEHIRKIPAILLYFFLSLSLIFPAEARVMVGKIYSESDIYAMSVEGFRLNMTQEEATRILKKNQWEGQWRDFIGPELEYPFKRGNATLYLMRYRGNDNQLHIWSVVNKQEFSRPEGDSMPVNRVLGRVWIDSIVAHYGTPSVDFINPNGINA